MNSPKYSSQAMADMHTLAEQGHKNNMEYAALIGERNDGIGSKIDRLQAQNASAAHVAISASSKQDMIEKQQAASIAKSEKIVHNHPSGQLAPSEADNKANEEAGTSQPITTICKQTGDMLIAEFSYQGGVNQKTISAGGASGKVLRRSKDTGKITAVHNPDEELAPETAQRITII